jgi:tetratricopeptide (TPR) repeat protein
MRRLALLTTALLVAMLARPALGGTPTDSPHARFARADRLMTGGRLEKAYALFEKLVEDYPRRWGDRARKKMAEIKTIVESRDRARAEADRLREAAGVAHGDARPWLLLQSARGLFAVRLYAEALKDASGAVGKPGSRFHSEAQLFAARCGLKLGKSAEAEKAFRAVLAEKTASRGERAAAWKQLAELVGSGGRGGELRKLLEEHIKRGPEEPGVCAAVDRYIAESLIGEKQSRRVGKVLWGLIRNWPAGRLDPEWVLIAARLSEFIARDYTRADKLYRLVLERYPETCFDLTMLKAGRRGADRGREVILASISRVAKKKQGKISPLKAPKAKERGASPENALSAVFCALRGGDVALARECASGKLAAELRVKTYPFRRYALSDYRILQSKETAPGRTEVSYEVAGEIGVTRILKRKAVALRKDGIWKISDLGM